MFFGGFGPTRYTINLGGYYFDEFFSLHLKSTVNLFLTMYTY